MHFSRKKNCRPADFRPKICKPLKLSWRSNWAAVWASITRDCQERQQLFVNRADSSSDCHRLENALCLCLPVGPAKAVPESAAAERPQELGRWFCPLNFRLPSGTAFPGPSGKLPDDWQGLKPGLKLNSAAWPTSCKGLFSPKPQYKLCGVWIKSVTDAKFESNGVKFLILMPQHRQNCANENSVRTDQECTRLANQENPSQAQGFWSLSHSPRTCCTSYYGMPRRGAEQQHRLVERSSWQNFHEGCDTGTHSWPV